jgi:ferrochelatase
MRYGKPTIKSAVTKLADCNKVTILPLFPQYSSAATGSAMQKVMELFAKQWNVPELRIINNFYNHPKFIAAYADIINKKLVDKKIDLLLFSYHGLPERHIKKSLCHATCVHDEPCPKINSQSLFCYRAQCYETSNLIAEKLNLTSNQYKTAFQSRLGRTPWIKPYIDMLLPELIQQGVNNIAVVCPSFVADCLETLEEVNIRLREQWQSIGGKEFTFIPCLNDHPIWVDAVVDLLRVG